MPVYSVNYADLLFLFVCYFNYEISVSSIIVITVF